MSGMKAGGSGAWETFRELLDVEEQMQRLFGRPGFAARWLAGADGQERWPAVDILEERDRVVVRADLPGMKQEEIGVEVSGGVLTIKGERKRQTQKSDRRAHRIECSYGGFLRSFSLPVGVEATPVRARYKHGVLEVILPKRKGSTPKPVKVDAS